MDVHFERKYFGYFAYHALLHLYTFFSSVLIYTRAHDAGPEIH